MSGNLFNKSFTVIILKPLNGSMVKKNGAPVESEEKNFSETSKATSSMKDADLTNERSTTITLRNNKSIPSCSEKQPAKKKRKYDSQYLSYGFTSIGDEKAPEAVCIFCHTILASSSLAPAKLQRHGNQA